VNSTISAGKCIWFGIQIKVRQPNTRHSLHALKALGLMNKHVG
jgi:hypothetical protein